MSAVKVFETWVRYVDEERHRKCQVVCIRLILASCAPKDRDRDREFTFIDCSFMIKPQDFSFRCPWQTCHIYILKLMSTLQANHFESFVGRVSNPASPRLLDGSAGRGHCRYPCFTRDRLWCGPSAPSSQCVMSIGCC